MRRNTMLLSALARAMNAGGSAIVSLIDSGAEAYNGVVSTFLPNEKVTPGGTISELEKNNQESSVEAATDTSKHPDHAAAMESEPATTTLHTIKEFNAEIERKKQRISVINNIEPDKQNR